MDIYPSLEELDKIINNIQDLEMLKESKKSDPLVSQSLQKQIMETNDQETKEKDANSVGRNSESTFDKMYTNKNVAKLQHSQTLQQARNILSSYAIDYKCKTLPPLFVRYGGLHDIVLPVTILPQGELVTSQRSIPDLVLNFSVQFGTILVTLCKINQTKIQDYKLVQKTLYQMNSESPIDLEQFQKLYDLARYRNLHIYV